MPMPCGKRPTRRIGASGTLESELRKAEGAPGADRRSAPRRAAGAGAGGVASTGPPRAGTRTRLPGLATPPGHPARGGAGWISASRQRPWSSPSANASPTSPPAATASWHSARSSMPRESNWVGRSASSARCRSERVSRSPSCCDSRSRRALGDVRGPRRPAHADGRDPHGVDATASGAGCGRGLAGDRADLSSAGL